LGNASSENGRGTPCCEKVGERGQSSPKGASDSPLPSSYEQAGKKKKRGGGATELRHQERQPTASPAKQGLANIPKVKKHACARERACRGTESREKNRKSKIKGRNSGIGSEKARRLKEEGEGVEVTMRLGCKKKIIGKSS